MASGILAAIWTFFFVRENNGYEVQQAEWKNSGRPVRIITHHQFEDGVWRCLRHLKTDCRICGPYTGSRVKLL